MAVGNPFGNLVYSLGHRNVQGLVWDKEGRLWETEHGQSGNDEINNIMVGRNYGWPIIQGGEEQENMITPFLNSKDKTWAPSGIGYGNNQLIFSGLRGEAYYIVDLTMEAGVNEVDKGYWGRVRNITYENNELYLLTSNTDGRGSPAEDDDKIIRVKL